MKQDNSTTFEEQYILACDERGTPRWPNATKTWTLGGLIVERRNLNKLQESWTNIKLHLCGSATYELKWSHFFPGSHQLNFTNPLLSKDPLEWREQANWALSQLFATDVHPVAIIIRKDKASSSVFKRSSKGKQSLDIDTIWVSVLAQFALFLEQHQATGQIWFDQLGSPTEEARKQANWSELRDIPWTLATPNQAKLQRIAPRLYFFDSKTELIIQVADFISGVFWAASEGDEQFLVHNIDKYFPSGPHTFMLMKIV
jgi:hypothetical protein